ncbi:MAG TPA: hypothetical protein VKC57_01115, partial [Ktedonobacterales bacterium]|nr:hypothetical protein [Ktedonobacterales bacterium]
MTAVAEPLCACFRRAPSQAAASAPGDSSGARPAPDSAFCACPLPPRHRCPFTPCEESYAPSSRLPGTAECTTIEVYACDRPAVRFTVQLFEQPAEPVESHHQSPIRRQYLGVKRQYPDAVLFFRMGDFYEMFDADAEL